MCFLTCRQHGSQYSLERHHKYPLRYPRQPAYRVVLPKHRLYRQGPDTQNAAREGWRVSTQRTALSSLPHVDLVCIFNFLFGLQRVWTHTPDSELRWHLGDVASAGRLAGSQQRASLPGHAARIQRLRTLGGRRAALSLCQRKSLLSSVWEGQQRKD